jgi:hypothetical protein
MDVKEIPGQIFAEWLDFHQAPHESGAGRRRWYS